jgi:hypothetical protein
MRKMQTACRTREAEIVKGELMFEKVEEPPVDPIMIGMDYFAAALRLPRSSVNP